MVDPQTKRSVDFSRRILLVGTKTGKCDLCKETKEVHLLKYGFTLCEDCINICQSILEQIQSATPKQKTRTKQGTQKQEASITKESANPKRATSATTPHLIESKNLED